MRQRENNRLAEKKLVSEQRSEKKCGLIENKKKYVLCGMYKTLPKLQ